MNEQDVFLEIIEKKLLIPNWMRQSFQNSIHHGSKIFSQKQLHEFINQDMEKFFNFELYSADFNLNDEQINKIRSLSSLGESLLYTSLRLNFGWGIPTEESISMIVKSLKNSDAKTMIEVGAGSGLWSALINARTEKDVIATELNLRNDTPRPSFYDVKNIDAIELLKERDADVLIVWPDTNAQMSRILDVMKSGRKLFLSGPPEVTGDMDFYRFLDENFSLEGLVKAGSIVGQAELFVLAKEKPAMNHHYFEDLIKRKKPSFKIKWKK